MSEIRPWTPAQKPSFEPAPTERGAIIGLRQSATKVDQLLHAHGLLRQMDPSIRPSELRVRGIGKDKIVVQVDKAGFNDKVYVVAVKSASNERLKHIQSEEAVCSRMRELLKNNDEMRLAASLQAVDGVAGLFTMDAATGDLEKHLSKHGNTVDALKLGMDMAKGVSQLHSMNRIHGDMKTDNYLVDANGNAYLADFGKSKEVDPTTGQAPGLYAGNTRIGAPEAKNSKKSDVYGLGIELMQVLEAKVRPAGQKSLLEPDTLRKDGVFANKDRRGIEAYMLNHQAFSHRMCETKGVGWKGKMLNMYARARTAAQPSYVRKMTSKEEKKVLNQYIQKLCSELKEKKIYSDKSIDTLEILLEKTLDPNPAKRPAAQEVVDILQRISNSESKKPETVDTKISNLNEKAEDIDKTNEKDLRDELILLYREKMGDDAEKNPSNEVLYDFVKDHYPAHTNLQRLVVFET